MQLLLKIKFTDGKMRNANYSAILKQPKKIDLIEKIFMSFTYLLRMIMDPMSKHGEQEKKIVKKNLKIDFYTSLLEKTY